MSWETLKPAAVTTHGKPMVSVLVRKLKSGTVSLRFSFSSFLQSDFGDPTKAVVQVGGDDEAGQIRFGFGKLDGDFAVKGFGKGGFSLLLPAVAGAPDRDHGSEPCPIVSKDLAKGGGHLVVSLPLDAWGRRPAAPSAPPPPRMAGGAPEPPASNTACPARPLDAIEYLKAKGHAASRLAEGRWSLDGDTVTKGAIVKAINKHRDKAGLDPLNTDSVN